MKCPMCSADILSRERRPNGNAVCNNGHVFRISEIVGGDPKQKYINELIEEHNWVNRNIDNLIVLLERDDISMTSRTIFKLQLSFMRGYKECLQARIESRFL